MVPTIVEPFDSDSSTEIVGAPKKPRTVVESIVCIEFVDELAIARGSTSAPLLPKDPWARAAARVAADQVHKTVCSEYYKVSANKKHQQSYVGIITVFVIDKERKSRGCLL